MPERPLPAVRRELELLWGRLGPFWGIPPATARVYGYLLGSPEGEGGETIADELGLSRGAVSMSCRELVDWGLVHGERQPGTRRTLYRIEEDVEKVIRAVVATRKRREWDPILESVGDWRRRLAGDRTRASAVLRERLAEIEGIVALVDSMAERFLKGGVVQRLGLKALVAGGRKRTRRGR